MTMNWLKKLKNIIVGKEIVSQKAKLEAVSIAITIVHLVMLLMFQPPDMADGGL